VSFIDWADPDELFIDEAFTNDPVVEYLIACGNELERIG